MTIEQKPELNRFVDPSIPLTWAWRWRQFKFALPVLAFIWACLIEMGLFTAWLTNRLTLEFVMTLAAICLVIPVFIMGLAEIQIRIRQRSKRVVEFTDKKIIIKPSKNAFVPWTKVDRFRLEPVSQSAGLIKLTLFLKGFPKKKQRRLAFWSMVLESFGQTQELGQYLQRKKMESATNYEIETLQQPAPPERPKPFPFLGLSLYMGGIYLLLVHGVPMLVPLLDHHAGNPGGDSKFSPEERAKLGNFIQHHFSSREEFQHFYLVSTCKD